MITHRQSWQLPLLILLSLPLWQSPAARFLAIDQGILAPPVRRDSGFSLEGVSFSQTSAGIEDITLQAKRLHGKNADAVITLEEMTAQRLGDHPVRVESGTAIYDPDQDIATLVDDVRLETDDLTVSTPFMRYLLKHDTIKSAAEVSVTGKEVRLSGTSFMYNMQTKAIRVGERVRFTYEPLAP